MVVESTALRIRLLRLSSCFTNAGQLDAIALSGVTSGARYRMCAWAGTMMIWEQLRMGSRAHYRYVACSGASGSPAHGAANGRAAHAPTVKVRACRTECLEELIGRLPMLDALRMEGIRLNAGEVPVAGGWQVAQAPRCPLLAQSAHSLCALNMQACGCTRHTKAEHMTAFTIS
jgi:hypothetical protein